MSDEVVETAREWLAKASSDWLAIEILSGHSDCPRETVCFHCQQYVEKLLKALLTLHGIEAPRTHFLRRLIQLSSPLASNLSQFADRADSLSAHAVQTRRPDDWREVGESEMREMVELAKEIGAVLLPLLPRMPQSNTRQGGRTHRM
jgi:HEPN domain-containing protein